jgi:hypothetical protein
VGGGKVVSEFVGVEDDWGCVEVERPEEIIDKDTKVRDDRIRSDVGLDVLMTITFEFAENDKIPRIESFLTTLWDEREYTRKSGP